MKTQIKRIEKLITKVETRSNIVERGIPIIEMSPEQKAEWRQKHPGWPYPLMGGLSLEGMPL